MITSSLVGVGVFSEKTGFFEALNSLQPSSLNVEIQAAHQNQKNFRMRQFRFQSGEIEGFDAYSEVYKGVL